MWSSAAVLAQGRTWQTQDTYVRKGVAVSIFSRHNFHFNYPKWWARNRGYYEKMQAEFGFEPLTPLTLSQPRADCHQPSRCLRS